MNIDVTKPVKTRDGRKARYLGTLAGECMHSVVYAVTKSDGNEYITERTLSGHLYTDGTSAPCDIVQAPVTVEKFLNVYPTGSTYAYADATKAQLSAKSPSATLRLTYEDDNLVSVDILPG